MSRLKGPRPNAAVRGIRPDALVTVMTAQSFGSQAFELTDETAWGRVANEILYSFDKLGDLILGIVQIQGDGGRHPLHYVRSSLRRQFEFGVASVSREPAEPVARVEAQLAPPSKGSGRKQ